MDYIYREFTLDFFKMDLNSLPKNASSLKFSKFNSNVMGLFNHARKSWNVSS